MGGCNERYDYEFSEEEFVRQRQEEETRKRFREAREKSETIWVRFVEKGLAGITEEEFVEQKARTRRIEELRAREEELRKEVLRLEKERHELRASCIHIDRKGESAFERVMYDICRFCGDMR